MKIDKAPNGNLVIVAQKEDIEELKAIKDLCGDNDIQFMDEMLESNGWAGNSVLMRIDPEDVGALTDAPIVTDDRTIEDNGSVTVNGNVWWFPNYMVENFAETLIREGSVTFVLATDVEKNAPKESSQA
jgi:hypothetical protein